MLGLLSFRLRLSILSDLKLVLLFASNDLLAERVVAPSSLLVKVTKGFEFLMAVHLTSNKRRGGLALFIELIYEDESLCVPEYLKCTRIRINEIGRQLNSLPVSSSLLYATVPH